MKYSRVTYAERCQIFVLLQEKMAVLHIAKSLNRHKSTIYRELKRNSVKKSCYSEPVYQSDPAHCLARKRFRQNCRRKLKVEERYKEVVCQWLKRGWSPELIAGRIALEKHEDLSAMTIYRFIKRHSVFKQYLLYKGRRYPRIYNTHNGPRPKWWKNIKSRPEGSNNRSEIGHWERDLMYAKRREPLLACTDRKSRFTVLSKLCAPNSAETQEATKRLLDAKPKLSITNDCGSEFRSRENIGCEIYFCDPGSPYQRGTIENTIGVIRRFIKSDTDLETINLPALENWLNHRPRKVLDYLTPFEVFNGKRVALAL